MVVSGDMIEGTVTATLLDRATPGAIEARRQEAGRLYSVAEFAAEIVRMATADVPTDTLTVTLFVEEQGPDPGQLAARVNARLDDALGRDYSRTWAELTVVRDLDGRTTQEALDSGMAPKQVWAAVRRQLELPASER